MINKIHYLDRQSIDLNHTRGYHIPFFWSTKQAKSPYLHYTKRKNSPPQAYYANELVTKEGGFTCRRPLP